MKRRETLACKHDDHVQVLGTEQDELDLPDFDAVEYINRRFPDEDSLAGLDACIARFEVEIATLDKEVHSAVREQALASARASQDLTDARGSITELVSKIGDIKVKAERSEDMVQVSSQRRGGVVAPARQCILCRTSAETSRLCTLPKST